MATDTRHLHADDNRRDLQRRRPSKQDSYGYSDDQNHNNTTHSRLYPFLAAVGARFLHLQAQANRRPLLVRGYELALPRRPQRPDTARICTGRAAEPVPRGTIHQRLRGRIFTGRYSLLVPAGRVLAHGPAGQT